MKQYLYHIMHVAAATPRAGGNASGKNHLTLSA